MSLEHIETERERQKRKGKEDSRNGKKARASIAESPVSTIGAST